MLTPEEIQLAKEVIDMAMSHGADAARVTIEKSEGDLIDTLCGEIDNINYCLDRALSLTTFVDDRRAVFTTNVIERKSLEQFVRTALEMTRVIEKDSFQKLPEPDRCVKDALTGREMDLYDDCYESITPEMRKAGILDSCLDLKKPGDGYRIISEETHYSNSSLDVAQFDSQGLKCRRTDTQYQYSSEVVIEGPDGAKESGYWWDTAVRFKDLNFKGISDIALQKAVSKLGTDTIESGEYTMVVSTDVATKLVIPIIGALGGYSLQHKTSFLLDSLSKKIFGESLTLLDRPRDRGCIGSAMFDSEGVATKNRDIVKEGIVGTYFLDTYSAGKLGLEPTVEDATRIILQAYPHEGLTQRDILKLCRDGILVTGFNGGNYNQTTGDFSYGVEGFLFRDGDIVKPIGGMLITGNYVDLWNRLIFAGSDARECKANRIPTLAFADTTFSGI